MMMIAMQCIGKFLSPFTFSHHMKKETMSNVFKETPEKHTAEESKDNSSGSKTRTGAAVIQHIYHNRQIHPPDNQRMCFGQHFEVRVFEKLSLPFIMYFFELHEAKIRKGKWAGNGVSA